MQIASVPPPTAALQNAATGQTTGDSADRKADPVAGEVRYLNPRIQFDRDSGSVIIQYRDTKTGEVKEQFPPKLAAESYEKRAKANDQAAQGQTASVTVEVAEPARPTAAKPSAKTEAAPPRVAPAPTPAPANTPTVRAIA
jgi:hypothetical protein